MNYLSVDTSSNFSKSSSKDNSRLSADNAYDEVVLFDASEIWKSIKGKQKVVLSSLQVPVHTLPRRSSPLPSLDGDEVEDPNVSQIHPVYSNQAKNEWSVIRCIFSPCSGYYSSAWKDDSMNEQCWSKDI